MGYVYAGVDTPLTLSFFTYTALALVYGSILIYRRQKLMVGFEFVKQLRIFNAWNFITRWSLCLWQVALYWYLLLGFVDVQGNFLGKKEVNGFHYYYYFFSLKFWRWDNFCGVDEVNKAFQYSSITSVTLLDCWTIAWVIILTWIFLETRYSLWQFLGSAVCVTGLALVLLSDSGVAGAGGVTFLSFFFPSRQKTLH